MTDFHEMARKFMRDNSKPGWRVLSLDEWLAEYGHRLPADVLEEGRELLSNFSGYGGDA